ILVILEITKSCAVYTRSICDIGQANSCEVHVDRQRCGGSSRGGIMIDPQYGFEIAAGGEKHTPANAKDISLVEITHPRMHVFDHAIIFDVSVGYAHCQKVIDHSGLQCALRFPSIKVP